MRSRGIVSLITSFCLMCGLILPSNAEEKAAAEIQPLLDAVASAAMESGESVEIYHDAALTKEFADSFLSYARKNGALSESSVDFSDSYGMKKCIETIFDTANIDFLTDASNITSDSVMGVRMLDANVSPDGTTVQVSGDMYMAGKSIDAMNDDEYGSITWLDIRVSAECRRSDASPCGWIVSSFAMGSQLPIDPATDEYFSSNLVEYYNENLGFSLQYPAVFMDSLQEGDSGISGSLPDGTATFFAQKESSGFSSLQELVQYMSSQYPAASVSVNEAAGSVRLTQLISGKTQVDVYIISSISLCHMQLVYDDSVQQEYSMYAEYMTNSFISLENMIG